MGVRGLENVQIQPTQAAPKEYVQIMFFKIPVFHRENSNIST